MRLLIVALLGVACTHRVPVSELARPVPACCTGIADGRLRQILEAGAGSTDPVTRQIALAALVRADPAPGGGSWGRRARFDPDPFVQQRAAVALGDRAGDATARDLLRDMALASGLDGITRGRAAAAALRLDPDPAWLAAAWAAPDGWGSTALLAVGARWDPELGRRLGVLLASGEVPFEVAFWDLVRASGRPELAAGVIASLPRLDPDLEVTAVVALLGLDPAEGQARLAPLIRGDADRALEVVERVHGDPSAAATEVLRLAAAGAPGPAARAAALWLLLRVEGSDRALLTGIEDGDPEVRRISLMVAGELGGRGRAVPARVRSAVLAGLRDEDPLLQRAAVEAASSLGETAALTPLLDDESLELRVRVAALLSEGAAVGRN